MYHGHTFYEYIAALVNQYTESLISLKHFILILENYFLYKCRLINAFGSYWWDCMLIYVSEIKKC